MVILDKIINDLKAKLPFLKKPETEGDELEENVEADESSRDEDVTGATDLSAIEETEEGEDEVVASNASLIHKLKAKIQSLSKKPVSKSKTVEEEAPAEDDEAAKKKKRSRIIQAVIGLGLIAFLAEDYIVPKEEPIEAPVAPPVSRRKTPPTDQATTPPVDTTATTPSTDTTATTPSEVPPTETTPAVTTPTETTPSETVATEPSTTTETLPDSPVDVTSTEVPSEPSTETPDSVSTPTEEPAPDTTITDTPTETTPPTSMDTIDGETVTSDDNLTDQILQDLEKQAKDTQPKETVKQYVSPPDYEYRGRGLVYNCTGKHWACVDAPSFKICEDNASSTKFLNKTMECHPVNVYETQKGCENIQNRMVSTSTKTTFCN